VELERPARPVKLHGLKNGGKGGNKYLSRALDRSFLDAYIKKRVEKEN
jgi:hypothetical protein